MTKTITDASAALALAIWREQVVAGIGGDAPEPSLELIDDWLDNRTYRLDVLEAAANGDVAALVEVRSEAGISVFI